MRKKKGVGEIERSRYGNVRVKVRDGGFVTFRQGNEFIAYAFDNSKGYERGRHSCSAD